MDGARQPAKSFEDLVAWQKAHGFVMAVYALTRSFPREERYGLTSQFRRAAVSIAANIAEGFGKRSVGDKLRFLDHAQGSLEECRYFLVLTRDLGYAAVESTMDQLDEVARVLGGYVAALRRDAR